MFSLGLKMSLQQIRKFTISTFSFNNLDLGFFKMLLLFAFCFVLYYLRCRLYSVFALSYTILAGCVCDKFIGDIELKAASSSINRSEFYFGEHDNNQNPRRYRVQYRVTFRHFFILLFQGSVEVAPNVISLTIDLVRPKGIPKLLAWVEGWK